MVGHQPRKVNRDAAEEVVGRHDKRNGLEMRNSDVHRADRRLRQADPFPARYGTQLQRHRIADAQQVEIDRTKITAPNIPHRIIRFPPGSLGNDVTAVQHRTWLTQHGKMRNRSASSVVPSSKSWNSSLAKHSRCSRSSIARWRSSHTRLTTRWSISRSAGQ